MRILRIDQEVPYPPSNGGRLETYHTTRQLAIRGHEVTLLAFQSEERDLAPLRKHCELHAIPFHGRNSLPHAIRGVLERTPINYVKWRHHQMLNLCLDLLRTKPYDVLVVDHSALGWYVFQVRKCVQVPIVTRWHDLETLMWERWVQSQSNPIKRALGSRQCEFVRRFERKLAMASDVCLTIGAYDTALLQELAPGADVRFIPAGVDTDYYAPSAESQEPASILFLASHYKWHVNLDAAKWLYHEVMPRVWQRIPNAKLYMTGRDTPVEMQTWTESGRVFLTGYVPDERTLMTKASVIVVPLRLGAGIKLRLLTAFAAGKAVVSTLAGAEGVPDLVDGDQILIRNTAEEFAEATCEVIENSQLRRMLETSGRTLACRHYDWSLIGGQWEAVISSVSAPGRR